MNGCQCVCGVCESSFLYSLQNTSLLHRFFFIMFGAFVYFEKVIFFYFLFYLPLQISKLYTQTAQHLFTPHPFSTYHTHPFLMCVATTACEALLKVVQRTVSHCYVLSVSTRTLWYPAFNFHPPFLQNHANLRLCLTCLNEKKEEKSISVLYFTSDVNDRNRKRHAVFHFQ